MVTDNNTRNVHIDVDRIREDVPVARVLYALGFDTSHTVHGMYHSPFHKDSTPSFHIEEHRGNPRYNRWFDHSADVNRGGDNLRLVQLVLGLPERDVLAAGRWIIDNVDPTLKFESPIIDGVGGHGDRHKVGGKNIIDSIRYCFSDPKLISYARDIRGISIETLNSYCREIRYSYQAQYADGKTGEVRQGKPVQRPAAIGFPNISEDWALRHTDDADGGRKWKFPKKVSTGNNISFITSDGRQPAGRPLEGDVVPTRPSVLLFEGFFNVLTYIELSGQPTPGKYDIVALNAVGNLPRAYDLLAKYDNIVFYSDNDETGQKAVTDLAAEMARRATPEHSTRVINMARQYERYEGAHCNDLNDWHCARLRSLERKAEQERQAREEARQRSLQAQQQTPQAHMHR